MNYSLHINGLDNAFPREFGCDCPRCLRQGRATRKAVLFWDMDNSNTWITGPQNGAHALSLQLARDADVLGIDCNTWRHASSPAGKPASHASFHTQLPFVRALAPRETLLMHLSGHEDDRGDGFGWLDAEWQTHAQEAWTSHEMPGRVRVPAIGERISL